MYVRLTSESVLGNSVESWAECGFFHLIPLSNRISGKELMGLSCQLDSYENNNQMDKNKKTGGSTQLKHNCGVQREKLFLQFGSHAYAVTAIVNIEKELIVHVGAKKKSKKYKKRNLTAEKYSMIFQKLPNSPYILLIPELMRFNLTTLSAHNGSFCRFGI